MRLPYVQREALLLRYYYDFKIRDIAAITNTSPSNIKYRLKQGLNTLKTILQKEGITNENWF